MSANVFIWVASIPHYIIGIAVTGASDISTDLATDNQVHDYSFVTQPFTTDSFNVLLRCVTGHGPPGGNTNAVLGGWYFNDIKLLTVNSDCNGSVFQVRAADTAVYPGVINLYLCDTFTTNEEGVYSCIMMNSSIMEQTMRVGVYFNGRSELML